MFLRKSGIGAAVAALMAFAAHPAAALPVEWGLGFQPSASPVMDQIQSFHNLLLWIIVATCLFVLGLLVWIVIRYRAAANPVPSKVHHNTLLEVAWTLIPVIILVFIAVPSFRLLYFQETLPTPDVQIKAIGKVIEVETTAADVIHSFAMPQMGVKIDAVPGRLNKTWFRATKTGVFYGQCSELCGSRHAYMPIELHVVTDAEYAVWLAKSKAEFAALENGATRVASK